MRMERELIEIPGGGFVELLNVMGTDLDVVNAARVSFHKESQWEYAAPGDEESRILNLPDTRLIYYLARHGHWTPFAQPQAQFRIKMPIFCTRQWFKHQIGLTRNEVSRRYVDDVPEFWVPEEWRERADDKKQGSGAVIKDGCETGFTGMLRAVQEFSLAHYQTLIRAGVCPEQARAVLPQSMFTEFVETGSLAAYARIVGLRDAPDAQAEIRDYAVAVRQLLEPRFPVSFAALTGRRAVP